MEIGEVAGVNAFLLGPTPSHPLVLLVIHLVHRGRDSRDRSNLVLSNSFQGCPRLFLLVENACDNNATST